MKFGVLRILKSNETPDYQKTGYFWNQLTGCPVAKDGSLLPFFYAFTSAGSSITITSFNLQQIDKAGNVCPDCDYSLTSTYVTTQSNDEHTIFIYKGDHNILGDLSSYNNGIYRYKIVISTGKIFYSAPFIINDYKLIETISAGDFDHNDFDIADFY